MSAFLDQPVRTRPAQNLYTGVKDTVTAGTRVAVGSTTGLERGVTIKAKATNTGLIYVGTVAVASSNGYQLSPGEEVFIECASLATVYIDSAVNGEGVSYSAQ
jgi:hypothetical protein